MRNFVKGFPMEFPGDRIYSEQLTVTSFTVNSDK